MSGNPLNDYPQARKIAYYGQFVVAGLLTLVGIGFAAAGAGLPQWYVVASAVTQALWSYLGLTASQNVPSAADVLEGQAPLPEEYQPEHRLNERGYTTGQVVVIAAVVVLVILFLVWLLPLGVRG